MSMTESHADHSGAITTKAAIDAVARAERDGDVADQQTVVSAAESASPSRIAEVAAEAKRQARVVADQAAAKAKGVAEQATTKAKAAYAQARTLAEARARDGRAAIVERPYAAAGLVFLAGLVIGHALSGRGAQVVYLSDRRPH
jgi:membrane protein involved in colicin uptake